MRTSTRWTVAILAVVAALIAALAAQLGTFDDTGQAGPSSAPGAPAGTSAPSDEALTGPRQRADLPPCPAAGTEPGPQALRSIVLQCASDGAEVDVARALAGRPVVLNLWAYWCGPCAEELPAMAAYQQRVGSTVTVVTVHQDPNEEAALLRLAELGVKLPTLQDPDRRIAAALRVPNVMPATVVLRADGTVAQILPRPFTDADDIAAAVDEGLK